MQKQIIQQIENRRISLGMSGRKLAMEAGISPNQWVNIKQGNCNTTIAIIEKLMRVLGMSKITIELDGKDGNQQ